MREMVISIRAVRTTHRFRCLRTSVRKDSGSVVALIEKISSIVSNKASGYEHMKQGQAKPKRMSSRKRRECARSGLRAADSMSTGTRPAFNTRHLQVESLRVIAV